MVSLPSSGWDRVVHIRYGHQANWFGRSWVIDPLHGRRLMLRVGNLFSVILFKPAIKLFAHTRQTHWVLYGQASRAISTR